MPGYGDIFVGGLPPTTSPALANGLQLAGKTGAITWLTVHNYNAAARMVLLLSALPANNPNPIVYNGIAVSPIWAYPISGASGGIPGTLPVDWTNPPVQFTGQLWVVLSTVLTTPYTCTTSTSSPGDGYFAAGVNLA